MLCNAGCGRTLSQFALVAYIPGPLAEFLDRLRLDLTPNCNPRAHVTVLPPRPVDENADLREMIEQLAEESRVAAPIEVTLGDIDIFRASNVIYAGVARGERELHALHENLNAGQLEYDGPYPYHPHVTIAQDMGRNACWNWPGLRASDGRHTTVRARFRWIAFRSCRTWRRARGSTWLSFRWPCRLARADKIAV